MRLILFILLVLSSSLTHALDPLLSLRIGEAESKLKVIEDALKDPQSIIQPDVLSEFQEQQVFVRNTSNECIDNNEKAINRSADDLDLLGSQALLESADVSLKRE
ncbi:MAG: hypothetical protein HOE78_13240, partial [Gammaproteobacteria bacterium]|nr:hypothetical protein [Gammaproteobacteria bacterium]